MCKMGVCSHTNKWHKKEALALNWDNCKKCGSVFSNTACLKKHIIKFHSPYAALNSSFTPTNGAKKTAKSLSTSKSGKSLSTNKSGKNKESKKKMQQSLSSFARESFRQTNKGVPDHSELQNTGKTDGKGLKSMEMQNGEQYLLMPESIASYATVPPNEGVKSYPVPQSDLDASYPGENGDVTLSRFLPKPEKEKGSRFRVRSRIDSSSKSLSVDLVKKGKLASDKNKIPTSPLNKHDMKNILDSIAETIQDSSARFGYTAQRSIPFGQTITSTVDYDSSFETERAAPESSKNSSFTFSIKRAVPNPLNTYSL